MDVHQEKPARDGRSERESAAEVIRPHPGQGPTVEGSLPSRAQGRVAPDHETLERLSAAVSLTVMEIDRYPNELVPAFLLANLMSPALWDWRSEKDAHAADRSLLSASSRLKQLQRTFHRYTFLNLAGEPGGDPWGLQVFAEEEKRLGPDFVNRIRTEYDATFRKLAVDNPESQFGQIIDQPYYVQGLFPRLKNETLEVMNAFARVDPEGKRAGKCIGLGMLWAAAMSVWAEFPLDSIIVTGNRAHMFVFLNQEDGHLLNNTKWFSSTRINNQSELSEFVREVASGTETTFFYNPARGMCLCPSATSQIARDYIAGIYANIGGFVSNPLKHPDVGSLEFVESAHPLPDPREHESAASYQAAVSRLAVDLPGSVFEHALYAFRSLEVESPQAYARAALRDPRAKELAKGLETVEAALESVSRVEGTESIFGSRDRVAMPDETLFFLTGNDRDRALLLYALLKQSPVASGDELIAFSGDRSYVRHAGSWVDASNLTASPTEPADLTLVFSETKVVKGQRP